VRVLIATDPGDADGERWPHGDGYSLIVYGKLAAVLAKVDHRRRWLSSGLPHQ
jgi:hypothetical protein